MPTRPTKIVSTKYQFTPRGGRSGVTRVLFFVCDDDVVRTVDEIGEIIDVGGRTVYTRWRALGQPSHCALDELRDPRDRVLREHNLPLLPDQPPVYIVESFTEHPERGGRVLLFLCDNGVIYTKDEMGALLGISGPCFYQRWKRQDKSGYINDMRQSSNESGATAEYLALTGMGRVANIPEPTKFDRLYGMGE